MQYHLKSMLVVVLVRRSTPADPVKKVNDVEMMAKQHENQGCVDQSDAKARSRTDVKTSRPLIEWKRLIAESVVRNVLWAIWQWTKDWLYSSFDCMLHPVTFQRTPG